MKKGKTDIKLRLPTKRVIYKPEEIKKMVMKLKTKVYKRLVNKHDSDKNVYNNKVIDNLIFNKNTHLSVKFRDNTMLDFTDEFLKRYIHLSLTYITHINFILDITK